MNAALTPILLVDDEPSVLRFVARVLLSHGYTARQASTAQEALDALVEAPAGFELLLTDVDLDSITGPDLARIARYARPHMRVLYMTGDHGRLDGPWRGVDSVLSKPFTAGELVDAVARALGDRPSGPAAQ